MGAVESAVLCLGEYHPIPCDDLDWVPTDRDNCPYRFNPAQENCNLDAENFVEDAYGGVQHYGDACDPHPCGETWVEPDSYIRWVPEHPLAGHLVTIDSIIYVDARLGFGHDLGHLRTGVRFCICSVAEEDTVETRHECEFVHDGTGECSIAAHELYDSPPLFEGVWHHMDIQHRAPVPGTEFEIDGELWGVQEASLVYEPPEWDQRRSIRIDWHLVDDVESFGYADVIGGEFPDLEWDMPGVLWTHTPGRVGELSWTGELRALASHYLSRKFGRAEDVMAAGDGAGFGAFGPALIPSRRCIACGSAFPHPWLMFAPCFGLGCTQPPELRFSEGAVDASGLFAAGADSSVGLAGGRWIAASEPDSLLIEDGLRYAAVADDGTRVLAALESTPSGLAQLLPTDGTSTPGIDGAEEPTEEAGGQARGRSARQRNRPSPRTAFGAVVSAQENRLWIVGGLDGSGRAHEDLWSFSFRSRTWRPHPLGASSARPGRVLAATYDPYQKVLVLLDQATGTNGEVVRLLRIGLTRPAVEILASWPRMAATTTFAMAPTPTGMGFVVACTAESTHAVLHVLRDETGVSVNAYNLGLGALASPGLHAGRSGVSLLVEIESGVPSLVGHRWDDFIPTAGPGDPAAASRCF